MYSRVQYLSWHKVYGCNKSIVMKQWRDTEAIKLIEDLEYTEARHCMLALLLLTLASLDVHRSRGYKT